VEVDRLAVGGLALMERLVGYERAVLIDAVLDGRPAGTIAVGTLAQTYDRLTAISTQPTTPRSARPWRLARRSARDCRRR